MTDTLHDQPLEVQSRESEPMVEVAPDVEPTNHNIYDPRLRSPHPWQPFNQNPCAIYFYYLKFEDDNRPSVLHYFWGDGPLDDRGPFKPISLNKVEAVITLLAQNARDGGNTPAPDPAPYINFNNIKWRGISYVAIMLDEGSWYFDVDGPETGAIEFKPEEGGEPNHSFFDGKDLTVSVLNRVHNRYESRRVILFINHFKKNVHGEPVEVLADSQDFLFDVYSLVEYSGQADRKLRVILDPGGTNQGPALFP